MNDSEINDLLRYFILSDYRDGDYFLLEEYEELESILKRSPIAKELDDARYKHIVGKISDEEYNDLYNKYYKILEKKYTK